MAEETLAEGLLKEQARVRKVLGEYREVGPPGLFAATMIELDLQAADRAVLTGDVVEMLKAYKVLKNIGD